ncbi:hypothetical protein M378DRAFT_168351 [Amanita muscaria Koide BX008]|uniref:Uncharacterized protein n=1 Tax=Amanita muscaria (strain Koide BX008) TaxID=946122 RepID=A0A0C2WFL6_AMAMK|nr:hypothetical protein M378DRAFT_168351 [Amanita muscaria Koide BX008]
MRWQNQTERIPNEVPGSGCVKDSDRWIINDTYRISSRVSDITMMSMFTGFRSIRVCKAGSCHIHSSK